jgi:hypothetical protein
MGHMQDSYEFIYIYIYIYISVECCTLKLLNLYMLHIIIVLNKHAINSIDFRLKAHF